MQYGAPAPHQIAFLSLRQPVWLHLMPVVDLVWLHRLILLRLLAHFDVVLSLVDGVHLRAFVAVISPHQQQTLQLAIAG